MNASTGEHTLGPHVVGQRVVVRRVLPGRTGPTGGPAMTDVLGVCRSWGPAECEVERESGEVVRIRLGEIVSGKPVPPRPSVRLRIPAAVLHRHAGAMFPDLQSEPLGSWVLRGTPDGDRRRANSVLAVGDPGPPLAEAAARVCERYAARGRVPLAQVVVDDEAEQGLTALGWTPLEGVDDCLVLVAPVSRVLRSAPRQGAEEVDLRTDGDRVLATIAGAARARGVGGGPGDLVGLHDLWVPEGHRRRGVGTALTRAVLEEAAARGATTAYLQAEVGNRDARGLYEGLGFVQHHYYRYLVPPTVTS